MWLAIGKVEICVGYFNMTCASHFGASVQACVILMSLVHFFEQPTQFVGNRLKEACILPFEYILIIIKEQNI